MSVAQVLYVSISTAKEDWTGSEVGWMTLTTGNCCFGWHVTAREKRGTTLSQLFAPHTHATTPFI
jgi:hypothetical protein